MGTVASVSAILLASIVLASTGGCSGDEGKPGPDPTPGTTSGELADAGTGEEGGSGKLKAAEQGCHAPEDCETDHCFVGGNQSYCTIACTVATAPTTCTPPYTGACNKQGFCKRD